MSCEHTNELGKITYYIVDDRCDTDLGKNGMVWYACSQCDDDITELVLLDREIKKGDEDDKEI